MNECATMNCEDNSAEENWSYCGKANCASCGGGCGKDGCVKCNPDPKWGSDKKASFDRAFRTGWSVTKEKEDPCWEGYEQVGMKDKGGRQVPNCVPKKKKIKKSSSYCDCPSCELLTKALLKGKKKDDKPFHGYNPNKHSRKGGLNAKGRAKAKREEGANLKPPVTESNPTGKRKARKKSFCARMGGVKGPTSKGGKLTPKGAALKRWKC